MQKELTVFIKDLLVSAGCPFVDSGHRIMRLMLRNKLLKFYNKAEQATPAERKKFFDEYLNTNEKQENFTLLIFETLDAAKTAEHAEVIGLFFSERVRGNTSQEQFERYADIIVDLTRAQLKMLPKNDNDQMPDALMRVLVNYELATQKSTPMCGGVSIEYSLNDEGKKFKKCLVNDAQI